MLVEFYYKVNDRYVVKYEINELRLFLISGTYKLGGYR